MLDIIKIIIIIMIVVLLFLYYFNRTPDIPTNQISQGLVSPAYGRIYKIERNHDYTTIAIILTLFDIHVQNYPTNGTVLSHVYDNTGKFNLVFDLNKSALNEKLITTMKDEQGNLIRITQIAGKAARRIIWNDRIGEHVNKGDMLGRILLGSRVDIDIPSYYNIVVKEGDYVQGPKSTLAYLL